MSLDQAIRKNWIEIQKKHDQPVNAIGLKIDTKDEATLRVWREEGIDAFVRGLPAPAPPAGDPRLPRR